LAAGTPNGRVLRVPGKGVKSPRATGDLLATIQIVVPETLSDRAAELLKEFAAELPPSDPRAELMNQAGEL
jgi:molecular chaperone DnaJ